eukprot:926125_1
MAVLRNYYGLYGDLIELLDDSFRNVWTQTIVNKTASDWSITTVGLEQGRPTSQLLCMFYVDPLSIRTQLGERFILTAFVDDLGLLSTLNYCHIYNIQRWMQASMNDITDDLGYRYMGLKANKTQGIIFATKNMRRNWSYNIKCDIEIDIGGNTIKPGWKAVKYLGIPLQSDLRHMAMVNHITRKSSAAFFAILPSLYKLKSLSAGNHKMILETCILSILKYGLFLLMDSYNHELRPLQVFYHKVLRFMIGARVSTPLELVHFLSHSLKLRDLIRISAAKYWIHLLSLPTNHPLHQTINKKWWFLWKNYCILGTLPRDSQERNNPLWQCFIAAVDLQLTDFVAFKYITNYADIPKQPGYRQLLPPIPTNLSFQTQYTGRETALRDARYLILYCDGSVNKDLGGLGVNIESAETSIIDYGLCIG